MNIFDDFKSEISSQISIIYYLQRRFESEFQSVSHIIQKSIPDNIDDLYNNNSKLMNELLQACDLKLESNSSQYIITDELPNWLKGVDLREPIGELIELCIESIDNGSPLSIPELQKRINEINEINGDDYYNFSNDKLEEILSVSKTIFQLRKNNKLSLEDEKLDLLKTTIALIDVSSNSNIFRQTFINIFSLFDAYVFDCIKLFFYKHPTELENFFTGKELLKIGVDEIVSFTKIEELKNDIIQKQFAGRYLNDIISRLYNYKIGVFNNVKFPNLMEMISRRNIHIHNKGVVDNKYCEKYNIYDLKKGDYAFIDNNYLLKNVFNTLLIFAENLQNLLI